MVNESRFTPAQDAHIATFLPTYAHVTRTASHAELKVWKMTHFQQILDSPLFKGQLPTTAQDPVRGTDETGWFTRLVRKFSNYVDRDNKRLEKKRGLLAFSPLSGFALFARDHNAAILANIQDSSSKAPRTYAACHQEMWTSLSEEIRNEYHARAAATPAIEVNQPQFADAASRALNELCRSGAVGPLEIKAFWAFRNINGELEHGVINAHGADNVEDMEEGGEFLDLWKNFSHGAIPRPGVVEDIRIPRNTDGIPVFPDVKLEKLSGEKVREILERYLSELWQHAWPGYMTPPWTEMGSNPEMFYDKLRYSPPAALADPKTIDLGQLHQLAQFFQDTSSDISADPFTFSGTTFEQGSGSISRDPSPPFSAGPQVEASVSNRSQSTEQDGYDLSEVKITRVVKKPKLGVNTGSNDSIACRRTPRERQPKPEATVGGERRKPHWYIGIFDADGKQVGVEDPEHRRRS
ncbi:hypothetical protein C8R43DRAFT_950830 [Mycena crocata]|nr:hypothetical protein C8R43DRAFT_950830 [Mycena crocata]